MRLLFQLSYVLLALIIVCQAILLRQILRRTLWFKGPHTSINRREYGVAEGLLTGSPAPVFKARMIGRDGWLSTSELKGSPSMLVFVSPEESPSYTRLDAALHAWWHQKNGHIYLVCNGTAEACWQLAQDYQFTGSTDQTIPVVMDEAGDLARRFMIDSTPQAVALDEDARISRYGRPAANDIVPVADGESSHGAGVAATVSDEEMSLSEVGTTAPPRDSPCSWPDDRPFSGASFARVDTKMSCVMTRFRLRSAWSLIPFYLAFRRVRRSAQDVSGLLNSAFFIENLHTCYTMSIWKDDCSIVDFGSIREHVMAANSAFGPAYRKDLKRAEIWSAQFRMWAVSSHNLNWEGLDMRTALGEDQWARRLAVGHSDFAQERDRR